jgi:hypothetical protein
MTSTLKHQCDVAIASLIGETKVNLWWNSPNKAFEGATPYDKFLQNPDEVYSYLMSYLMR